MRVWAASLDLIFLKKFETFCELAPWNKLWGNTNFIIYGPTDQKLWRNKKISSLDRVGKPQSQPTRIDHKGKKGNFVREELHEKQATATYILIDCGLLPLLPPIFPNFLF